MTSLLDRPTGAPLDVRPAPTAAAVAAAAQAAGASLVAVLAPVVLAWVVDSAGRGTWVQAVRLALALWLLAQHGGLTVDGGHVGLVPLGLSLFPLAACWFGGRRLARVLDPRAEAIAAGATRAVPAWPPAVALATFPTAYCTGVAIAALAADMPSMHPIGLQAVLGAAVVSSVGVTLGAAGYRHRGAVAGLVRVVQALPAPLARCCGPGVAALAVQLGVAAVVLAALLGAGHARVVELHQRPAAGRRRRRRPDPRPGAGRAQPRDLDLGRPRGARVRCGCRQLDHAFVLEPGRPARPAGARCAPGARPPPRGRARAARRARGRRHRRRLAAGAVAGEPRRRSSRRVLDVAGVAVLAGTGLAVLAWLSGGPAGPGRLAETGPLPWLTGVAFAAEVAAGAALALAARSTVVAVRGGAMRRANE